MKITISWSDVAEKEKCESIADQICRALKGNNIQFNTEPDDFSDITVIIPTLNEESTISELIGLLLKFYPGIKVIVSDDGSRDKTQDIVRGYKTRGANVSLLDRSLEKVHGLTASVIDAIRLVKTEFFVVLDGDLQHPPEKIKKIVAKLRINCDIVIATREKMAHKWTTSRIIGSNVSRYLASMRLLLNGITIEDPLSGFFGARTSLVNKIIEDKAAKFEMPGYKVLFDILKYVPSGIVLSGIYFKFGTRIKGHSKINGRIAWIFLKSLFK